MLSKNSKTEKIKGVRSLTTTLSAAFFALSMMVLMAVVGGSLIVNSVNNQTTLSATQQGIAQNAAHTVSNSIEEKFAGLETAVEFSNPVLADSATRKTIMESLLGLHPAFRQFALLDKQGGELAQVSRASQSLSPQFALQLKGDSLTQTIEGKRYISPVYIDDITSEPQVAIAIPVQNVLGDYKGTLVAEVNLKFLWDLIDQVKVGETGYAYVVDDQGNLIAFRDTTRVLANENVKQIPEVKEFLKNSSATSDTPGEVTDYTGLLGKTVVGTYVPLGTPKWAVVTEIPTDEAYRPIVAQSIVAGIFTLVMAILAGLAGVFVARRLSAPLVDLSKVATEIGAGNLALQAKVAGPAEIAQVAETFNSMTSQFRDLIGNLEKRVDERTREIERRSNLLKAVAGVGKAITSFRDLSELLQQATYLIHENFGYYHVGIFLLDEYKEYAILRATNSEGGLRMLEKKHQLKVGETGIVGYVTQNAKARIALNVGKDATYFDNPDLPQTRSEMALPLIVGGQTLGALDVQSTESQAFTEEDISTLQILAEQIAIAIQNANLFNEAQKALEASRMSYGDISRGAWSKILRNQPRIGFLATSPTTVQIHSDNLEMNLTKAFETGDLIIGNDGLTISMPIRVRGQTIGAIRLKKSAISESWTQDEINLAISLSDQLSGALESARLYKESQQHAARETLISDITARITAVSNTETIVRETVQELGQTLGNASVTFQLLNQPNGQKQAKGDVLGAAKGQDKRNEISDSARKVRE